LQPRKTVGVPPGDPDDHARAAGLKKGDVVVGVDGLKPELTMLGFFGHIRKNYLVGDNHPQRGPRRQTH
jgi:hypothetical protein